MVMRMPESEEPALTGLLSASQAAERIGVSHREVNRLVNTGVIDIVGYFGVQRQLVFRADDIDAYIEAHHNT